MDLVKLRFFICFIFFISINLYAEDKDNLFDKAIESERQGNLDLALESLFAIIDVEPGNTAALVRAAKLLSWKNKFDEALVLLNQALDINDELAEGLFRKGQILSWMGNYQDSINIFIKYLSIIPDDSDGLLALGRVYFWSQKYDLALESFNNSLEHGADLRVLETEKAKVYIAMEQPNLAKSALREVLGKDPDYEEARRLLEGLEKLYAVEFFPVSGIISIYPDKSLGLTIDPGILFHFKNRWDVVFINEIQKVDELWDNTINIGAVYRGIDNLYLGVNTAYTPLSQFHPYLGLEGTIHASLGERFGAGIRIKGTFFDLKAPAYIGKEILLEVSPELSSYFGDMNYIKVSGGWYQFISGYHTLRVNLSTLVEYYDGNSVTASISYGGSADIMDNQRRTLEIGTGIKQSLSKLIDLSASYNYIDTPFGQTHQIGLKTFFHW